MVEKIIEKIIDGCNEVKKNPDIHKDAKTLATLVIKDCNDALTKKEWVGLTMDELNMISDRMRAWNSHSLTDVYVAIEAKLKEKNT